MTLIKEAAFHLKDKPPGFVLIGLRVTTNGTTEVPQEVRLPLELLKPWRQHIEIFDLSVH
jgi:hypothetical protein